ncbi:MAG: bifunctional phosphopantothenoylcysteine decarboxylase/phosphopantothenate--cysteine ligase CoaBC, partial [Candidatus Heimdallarchaeota archaeon]
MAKYKPNHHSSKLEITGKTSDLLKEKKIVIGLTGSVAVVETVHLARLLMRHGAEVIIAMTKAAQDLIQPDLLEWATGNPVIIELTGQIEHVHLCGLHPERADLLLIAPSTANTIGKIAGGIDDTVVTTFATTALGSKMPIAIVPAMHSSMYQNPVVVENIEKLKKIGIKFIGPRIEEGKAKIATNDDILEEVVSLVAKNDLKGKKVVITAGPTRAWIDDIRFITNPSSGKMGLELAKEAKSRGADVTLILGPSTLSLPNIGLNIIRIDTTQDIIEAINDLTRIDIFISAAAIGDYEPIKTKGKIPSKQ